MVSVQFLGSGDAFGSGGRLQACILVRAEAASVLLDCGASSLIAIKRAGLDPNAIDAVLVTHLHGDHFGGLPFFVLDAQFARRESPLIVAGPPGIEERVRTAMEAFFPGSSATRQRFELRFVELAPLAETAVGPVRVVALPVEHASGAPAYALRVACEGRVVAYSGDTAWAESLVEAADGADLFICEAYFFEKQVPFHLDYQTLLRHRDRLRCHRLVLTHMSADMLGHLDGLACDTAADGLTLDL